MPAQGIIVAIKAKIEGWQEQLKQIQEAAKKVDLRTSFGKDLDKSYKELEKDIADMSRNMRTKLTSDSNIDQFLQKVSTIDEKFQSIGSNLSQIDLASIDTKYLSNSFKALITDLESAKKELATGWDDAFQKGIASGTKLGNLLEKLKIDPKTLDIGNINVAIDAAMQDLEISVRNGSQTIDEMRQKLKELQQERDRYQSYNPINDIKQAASNVLGTPELYGKNEIINTTALNDFISSVTTKLNGLGESVQNKREEIDKALSELGKSVTVDELKSKLDELQQIGKDSGIRGLGLTKAIEAYRKNVSEITSDSTKLEEGLKGFKERLLSYGVSEDEINKLLPDIRENIWNDKFGKISTIVENILLKTKANISEELPKILQQIATLEGTKEEVGSIKNAMSTRMSNTNLLSMIDRCRTWIAQLRESMMRSTEKNRERVSELERRLQDEGTADVRGVGNNISRTAAQQLQENAAAAMMYKEELAKVQSQEQMVGRLQFLVQRWFSVYAAVRMVRQGIQSIIQTISELDKTITNIAIVTDMGQDELWNQMPKYTQMAREYAASISGVYEVSQLYYQQGLGQNDVMTLTEETLKMARISGLDYADATDYMTNAIRSFKMEMSEASTVVDVYSAVAASSATSVTELASAMSKTASSAEAVGSSFENTTAMMAVMIEATRESPENIGSALKSIISRYGELKENKTGIDAEGEEYSLNKVDTALQSVGISIHDAEGQFRDFDEVIMELAEHWDQIDVNTQRYIATIMAGNRQQSRFLALVSSYDRLKELSATAADSEDAAQQQYIKTLDSIQAKQQQLKTSVQDIYASSGVQNFYKTLLDLGNNIVVTFDQLSEKMGVGTALAKMGSTFTQMAVLATQAFKMIKQHFVSTQKEMELESQIAGAKEVNIKAQNEAKKAQAAANTAMEELTIKQQEAQNWAVYENAEVDATITAKAEQVAATKAANAQIMQSNADRTQAALDQIEAERAAYQNAAKQKSKRMGWGMVASAVGLGLQTWGASLDVNEHRQEKALLSGVGSALSGVGTWAMIGGVPGAIVGTLSAIPGIIEAIGMSTESIEEKIKRLKDTAKEANDERIKTNQEYKTLNKDLEELEKLTKARYDSADAMDAYREAVDKLAESNPDLVSGYTNESGAIIDLTKAYDKLIEAREKAGEAAVTAAASTVEVAKGEREKAYKVYGEAAFTTASHSKATYLVDGQERDFGSIFGSLTESSLEPEVLGYEYLGQFLDALEQMDYTKLGEFGSNSRFRAHLQDELNTAYEEDDLDYYAQLFQGAIKALYGDQTQNKDWIETQKRENAVEQAIYSEIATNTSQRIDLAELNSKYKNAAPINYLTDFVEAQEIINSYINDQFYEQEDFSDITKYLESDQGMSAYQTIEENLKTFWQGLGQSQDEASKLIANRGKYTLEQFKNKIMILAHIDDDEDPVLQALLDYYENNFNIDQFKDAIAQRHQGRNDSQQLWIAESGLYQQLGDIFAPDELADLLSEYDALQKLVDNKGLGLIKGQDVLNKYIQMFSETNNEDVQAILTSMDLTDFSSVSDAITQLKDKQFNQEEVNGTLEILEQILTLIPLNVYTATQSLLDKITEGISDFQTSVKNATEGMDFKEYRKEIDKHEFSESDFEFKNGQYYAKDYVAYVNTLMNKLLGDNYDQLIEQLNKKKAKDQNLYKGNNNQELLGLSDEKYDKLKEEYQQWKDESSEHTSSFIEWYYDNQIQQLEDAAGEAREYATDMVARSALESGKIKEFATLAFGDEWEKLSADTQNKIIQAISTGDISGLTEEQIEYLKQYQSLIIETYEDIQKDIASSLFKALNGGATKIKVTETNINQLKDLQTKGYIKEGELNVNENAQIDIATLYAGEEEFFKEYYSLLETDEEKLSAVNERHKYLYKNSTADAIEKIADQEVIAFEDFQEYLAATGLNPARYFNTEAQQLKILKERGLKFNDSGDIIVDKELTWQRQLQSSYDFWIDEETTSVEQRNAILEKFKSRQSKDVKDNISALENILSKPQNITDSMITALADSLHKTSNELEQYFISNGDGTSRIDISDFVTNIKNGGTLVVNDTVISLLSNSFGQVIDTIINGVKEAGTYAFTGTNSREGMEKFTEEYNRVIGGDNVEWTDLFTYKQDLHNWTLNLDKLQKYKNNRIKELVDTTLVDNETAKKLIEDETTWVAAQAIDLEAYRDADHRTENDQAYKTLHRQLENYYSQLEEYATLSLEGFSGYDLQERIDENERRKSAMENAIKSDMDTIAGGGLPAVQVAKRIAKAQNITLTADELQEYYAPLVKKYMDIADQLAELSIGSFIDIDSDLGQILNKIPGLLDENGLVTSVDNLAQAYLEIYNTLNDSVNNTAATLRQKNEVYAKYLTANEQKEIDAIETLGNAMSMSYDEFATLLSNNNKDLKYVIENSTQFGINQLGNGKIQISEFTKFASFMDWNPKSNEYVQTFKAYNEQLIEYQDKVKNNILGEVDALKQFDPSKGEQKFNLTQLAFSEYGPILSTLAEKFNIAFKDGILTLVENSDYTAFMAQLMKVLATQGIISVNEFQSEFDRIDTQKSANIQSAFNNIISNYNSITIDMIYSLAEALDVSYEELASMFVRQGDGTYKADLSQIQQLVVENQDKLTNATLDSAKKVITEEYNNILNSITTATNYSVSGTTNIADMQEFVNKYNAVVKDSLTINELFSYDSILNQFTLSGEILRKYVEAQKETLRNLGFSTEDLDDYFESQTKQLIQSNMDVLSFINSVGNEKDVAASKLAAQIQNIMQLRGFEINESVMRLILHQLNAGGESAIRILKYYKGEENISTEEYQAVYNASINRLKTAEEDIVKGVGETVSGIAIQLLEDADFTLVDFDGDTAVIAAVGNLAQAYHNLYDEMREHAQATTEDLNRIYAQSLMADRQQELDSIELLSNASNLTYESLGQLLSKYNILLEDVINELDSSGLEDIGNGNVRITDFKLFAKRIGLDANIDSEAFLSAYKAYNDGLIELNNKAKSSISDEINALTSANGGDWLNLTEFANMLSSAQIWKSGDDHISRQLLHHTNLLLLQYGAAISDGILKLTDKANIIGVAKTLEWAAKEAGFNDAETLAQIQDAIQEIIKSYVDAIKNGINGTLDASGKLDLINKAASLGINNLNFSKTTEGFKLAKNSAIELYKVIQQIDALQGEIVFNELSASLQENDEHYASVTSTLNYIKELTAEIARLEAKTDRTPYDDTRIKQYTDELALAQQINIVRSTTEDSSFNFMSNAIPAAQNNPLNYAKNWTQAFQTFRDAFDLSKVKKNGKSGFMDYQDWYNIVTEMNNIATKEAPIILSDSIKLDGTLTAAANAIQAGARALTTVDTGELKVNLTDVGIGIKSGAAALNSGVTDGIHDFANAQIQALDGLIALLELVVTMEQLGDIDVEGNGIDLSDLFTVKYDPETGEKNIDWEHFNEAYDNWRKDLIKKFEDYLKNGEKSEYVDLGHVIGGIEIDGHSLYEILKWEPGDFKDAANANVAKVYTALLNALNTAFLSGDYDLNNIAQSVQQELTKSGLFDEPLVMNIGNITYVFTTNGATTVDWSDEELAALAEEVEGGKARLIEALEKFTAGKTMSEEDVTYVLALRKYVKITDDGTAITINNHTYNAGEEGYGEALGAALAKEAGVIDDIPNKQFTGDTFTTQYTFPNKKEITVTAGKDGIWYHSDTTGADYSNINDLLQAEYQKESKEATQHGATTGSFDKWVYGKYGIKVELQSTIVGSDGNPLDFNNDPGLRESLKEFQQQLTPENLTKLISPTGDGNYKATLPNGVEIQLDGTEITTSGELDKAKIDSALDKALGFNKAMQENITIGVQAALTTLPDIKFDADTQPALDKLAALKEAAKSITSDLEVNSNETEAAINNNVVHATNNPAKQDIRVERNYVWNAIDNNVRHGAENPVHQGIYKDGEGTGGATGNLGLAQAKGTLMGELGPELVVSRGHYFVVGQNGPEMVDLDDDAIVFNHLQTKSLLEKGMSSGRGRAVTNEYNAVSYATGNVNGGPAMASASAALAALKELRAQWQALLGLSARDLAGKGGGGGGGGGDDNKAFVKELERWYNWLQRIAELEEDINFYEKERSLIQSRMNPSGEDYYKSLKKTTAALKEELAVTKDLYDSQRDRFNTRRSQLNSDQNPFNSLYEFDEYGQLKYKNGKFKELSEMVGTDQYNSPNMTAEEQYKYIIENLGIDEKYLQYDTSGNKIEEDDYAGMVQAFWDKIDADKEEMQSLHDSINEYESKMLELEEAQNEIAKEMRDNQLEVEQKVYNAVVEIKQRAIDELQDTRDAIEESNSKLIDGLSKALSKEQDMYNNAESERDLRKLQAQLNILERSGGSAAEISDLQEQIASKQKDMYFDARQQEIDKIQEASDKQIEKLDSQIDLMTETLDYQKEHGQLWRDVYKIMQKSPEEIADYIAQNTSSYWGESAAQFQQSFADILYSAEIWTSYRDDMDRIAGVNKKDSILTTLQAIKEQLVPTETTPKEPDEPGKPEEPENGDDEDKVQEKPQPKKDEKGENVYKYSKYNDKQHKKYRELINGSWDYIGLESHTWANGECKYCHEKQKHEEPPKKITSEEILFNGLNSNDLSVSNNVLTNSGLLLNDEQARILSKDLLDNQLDSFMNISNLYHDISHNLASNMHDSMANNNNNNNNNNNATNIEKIEINMHVNKLANDYDARRAADTAMNEILRIAQKTSANNSIRR